VPNNHQASVEIVLRCATYRFHHEQWPTRLEIGPYSLWALARELGRDHFMGVVKRLEIVLPEGWGDDLSSQMQIDVSGEAGRVASEELIPRPFETQADGERWRRYAEEAREWLGLPWARSSQESA
jgi:hypothetical protein